MNTKSFTKTANSGIVLVAFVAVPNSQKRGEPYSVWSNFLNYASNDFQRLSKSKTGYKSLETFPKTTTKIY